MTTRDREKKSRVARDFRRVLIVLVIIFVAILGRQEYKIHQIQKETDATRKRVEELQKVQADLEAERTDAQKDKNTKTGNNEKKAEN